MNTLLIQLYETNTSRAEELMECTKQNVKLGFDRVIIWSDSNLNIPSFPKTVILRNNNRLTFSNYLRLVTTTKSYGITVLTNTDIILDESILTKCSEIGKGELFAISRYEANRQLNETHWCCQDSWVLRNQDIGEVIVNSCSFELGRPGCELRFAESMFSYGFTVSNPSLSIINHHVQKVASIHQDSERYYGAYLFTPASTLHHIDDTNAKPSPLPVYLKKGSSTVAIPNPQSLVTTQQ